jgi:hypothetical protein
LAGSAIRRRIRLAAMICAIGLPGTGSACDLALVLGMDVSASVDAREYRLQMEGTAAALTSGPVRAAMFAGGGVALSAFLWSGTSEQVLIAEWRMIGDSAALERFAATLAEALRPDFAGRTATGEALAFGAAYLALSPPCVRQVIDLATDGERNSGRSPREVMLRDVTVNALSIGGDLPLDHGIRGQEPGLTAYLEAKVIHGPGAFVEPAEDFADVARAMERKLLREIRGLTLARGG